MEGEMRPFPLLSEIAIIHEVRDGDIMLECPEMLKKYRRIRILQYEDYD